MWAVTGMVFLLFLALVVVVAAVASDYNEREEIVRAQTRWFFEHYHGDSPYEAWKWVKKMGIKYPLWGDVIVEEWKKFYNRE